MDKVKIKRIAKVVRRISGIAFSLCNALVWFLFLSMAYYLDELEKTTLGDMASVLLPKFLKDTNPSSLGDFYITIFVWMFGYLFLYTSLMFFALEKKDA
jgi:hypothetical protein